MSSECSKLNIINLIVIDKKRNGLRGRKRWGKIVYRGRAEGNDDCGSTLGAPMSR